MAVRDDTYWRRAGLNMGRERGELDRRAGTLRDPNTIWIPDDVPPAYISGLREGYHAAVTGAPVEDL